MKETESMNFTYMVRCSDGSLYTGWTTDPEMRIKAHNTGKGARYTRSRRPVSLVYLEAHDTRREAMHREAVIKKLSRKEKEQLVDEFQKL